jgi:hypothetical protein
MDDGGHDQKGSDVPSGLALERHRDWQGRGRYVWVKRVITGVLVVFVAAALLNVFGQRTVASTVQAPSATLTMTTPHAVRLGLIYQTRIDITAHRTLRHPVLTLSPGWFDGSTLNSTEPSPLSEASSGSGVAFGYARLAAGRTMSVFMEWSANPTAPAWRRAQEIRLLDGRTPILQHTIHVTVFP